MNSLKIKRSRNKRKISQQTQMMQFNQIPRSKTLTVNLKTPNKINEQKKNKRRRPSNAIQEDQNSSMVNPDMLKSTMIGQNDQILYKKTTVDTIQMYEKQPQCQRCHFTGQPIIKYENGQTTYFWCIGLAPILLFWVPFILKKCKNEIKICSNCKYQIECNQPRCL